MTAVVERWSWPPRSLRRRARARPEILAGCLALAAWAVAAVWSPGVLPGEVSAATPNSSSAPAGDLSPHLGHGSPGQTRALLDDLAHWSVMSVAMMVPAALPAVHHVGVNSLRWRRQRAVAQFLLGYLAVWSVFGLVVLGTLTALQDRLPDDALLLAGVAGVGLWQVLPFQRRAVNRCHRTVPLPPLGWPAVRGAVRFGYRHGTACLGVCGPVMVLMAATLHQGLVWMAVLALATLRLKLGARRVRGAESAGWGLLLGSLTALTLLA